MNQLTVKVTTPEGEEYEIKNFKNHVAELGLPVEYITNKFAHYSDKPMTYKGWLFQKINKKSSK